MRHNYIAKFILIANGFILQVVGLVMFRQSKDIPVYSVFYTLSERLMHISAVVFVTGLLMVAFGSGWYFYERRMEQRIPEDKCQRLP